MKRHESLCKYCSLIISTLIRSVLQEGCRAHAVQGGRKIAILHLDFAHHLFTDPERALSYAESAHPVWSNRFGPGIAVRNISLVLFPFHDKQHYVRHSQHCVLLRLQLLLYVTCIPRVFMRQSHAIAHALSIYTAYASFALVPTYTRCVLHV